jgi:Zn-dependent protease
MGDFRLGSVLGFEIRVDLSWFVIFFLIFWSLAAGVFPAWYPELGSTNHTIMGGVGAILFFISLLAHELSHSLVARAKGIPVQGITLFIFGGMARTGAEAETPRDEFVIAGVGPLTSFAVAFLFWVISWMGLQAGWSLAITGVARYLAFINVVLAVFNLLPGFPLDGGRLFRALVWGLTGDLTKATRWAATGGRWLATVLMVLGILQTLGGAVLGGIWLLVIGWFLRTVASMSLRQHLVQHVLERSTAGDVMTPRPETVPATLTLEQLVGELFLHRRYQSFPVVLDGALVGVITLHEVKPVPREMWPHTRVLDVMTPIEEVVTVAPHHSMADVFAKMAEQEALRVLVVRGDVLVGIISASDVAAWVQRIQAAEALMGREPGTPAANA